MVVDVGTCALLIIRGLSFPSTQLSARRWSWGVVPRRCVSCACAAGYWLRRAHSETGGGGAITIEADAAETACAW